MSDIVDTDAGNTKKSHLRSRCWCFTWNNPEDDTVCTRVLEWAGCSRYVFQLEIGENGTEHMQGTFYFENARSFSSVKRICPKWHIEVCRSWKAAIAYCSKEDTRVAGPWIKGVKIARPLILKEPQEGWQMNLVSELNTLPDDRKIIWYSDPVGGAGKTTLARWLVVKHKAFYCNGKRGDVLYGAAKHLEKHPEVDVVIFGFARTYEQFVSYDAIEQLKDGIFYNTKYESGCCVFNPPHVVVFANFSPDESSLTSDRWDIRKLSEKEEETFEVYMGAR